ncbi:MAG: Ig-like domain-containing protein [Myxococcota bacterium]|nr:Ig-like domain-containing protein [Myxococcota bacterium]
MSWRRNGGETRDRLSVLLGLTFGLAMAGCIDVDSDDDDATEPPSFEVADLEIETQEDTALEITLPAPTGGGEGFVEYSIVSGPSTGSLEGEGSSRVYTPGPDFNGVDSFRFAVSLPPDSAEAEVRITIHAVADAPDAVDDLATLDEDGAASINVLANDSDAEGDALTVVGVATPNSGQSEIEPSGLVRYTPDPDFFGTDSFNYIVEDATGESSTGLVTVTVVGLPDPPSALDDVAGLDEDASQLIDVLANDVHPDGNSLLLDSVGSSDNGSTAIDGQQVLYVPDPDFNGTDLFEYTVIDPLGATATATVVVTVQSLADPPTATTDLVSLPEDSSLNIEILANDFDGDGDSFAVDSITTPTSGVASLDSTAGTVLYTPDADFNGVDSFTYTITDSTGLSSSGEVSITVTAVNDPPVGNDQSISVGYGSSQTVAVDASDIDGDSLLFQVTSSPSLGQVSGLVSTGPTSASFLYTADGVGTDLVGLAVSDGAGGLDSLTVTIEVVAPAVTLTGNHTFDTDLGELDGVPALGWDGSIWVMVDFTVASGAALVVVGGDGLEIDVSGDALIAGEIDLSGGDGGDVNACDAVPAGAGGAAGPGGYAGGPGGGPSPGSSVFGIDGSGPGGGDGGYIASNNAATGGGGGGHQVAGGTGGSPSDPTLVAGGSPYSSLPPLQGGSGGGGGSVEPDFLSTQDDSGAGGGGGGGALSIVATGSIIVGLSALVDASGGDGGVSTCGAGSGGGGAGGAIELLASTAPSIVGVLDASGGSGGSNNGPGGDGGDGYIVTGTAN